MTIDRRTFLKMAGVATPAVAAFSCADRESCAHRKRPALDRGSVDCEKAPPLSVAPDAA